MRYIALLGLFAGCATARPMMSPSGNAGFYVECRARESACFDKAAEVCPMGYRVVHATSRDSASASCYGETCSASTHFRKGTMLVECRG